MECRKCKCNFEPKHNLVNYCSYSCRNSRKHSDETKRKISKALRLGLDSGMLPTQTERLASLSEDKRARYYARMKELGQQKHQNALKRLMEDDFETLAIDRRRLRILTEQNNTCIKCGIHDWLGQPLSLEIDHIDGNNTNNSRENLEALCPNCHSQTPTFRGRNKKKIRHKVSDEILAESLIRNEFNMRAALLEVGLAAKGGNYPRCHRIKREFFSK